MTAPAAPVALLNVCKLIVEGAMPATTSGHTCFVPRYQIDNLRDLLVTPPASERETGSAEVGIECITCQGVGTIDERLGGEYFSNPAAECPDCDGVGEYRKVTHPALSPASERETGVGSTNPRDEAMKLADALESSQQQCDEDGQMIQCSRQAVVESIAMIRALAAAQQPVVDDCLLSDLRAEAELAWPSCEPAQFIGSREQRLATLCRRAVAALRRAGAQQPVVDETSAPPASERETAETSTAFIGCVCPECNAEFVASGQPPAKPDATGKANELPVHKSIIRDIEVVGKQCLDGGKCHHSCETKCFRRDGCVPLSIADSYLKDDWTLRDNAHPPAEVERERLIATAKMIRAEFVKLNKLLDDVLTRADEGSAGT